MQYNKLLIKTFIIILLVSATNFTKVQAATNTYDCTKNICIYVDQSVPTSYTNNIFTQADIITDTDSDGTESYPFITVQSALNYIKSYPNAQNYSFVLFIKGNCAPTQNFMQNDWWYCSFTIDSTVPKITLTAAPGQTDIPQMDLQTYLSVVTLNNANNLTIDGLKFSWTNTDTDKDVSSIYSNFHITGSTKNVKIINNVFEAYIPEYGAILEFTNNIEDSNTEEATITNNTFSGRFASAIYLNDNGVTGIISGNQFINPNSPLVDTDLKSYAISINKNSKVNGNVEKNDFQMTGKAIYGNGATVNGSITNNQIKVLESGIHFDVPSDYMTNNTINQISGDISNNQITISSTPLTNSGEAIYIEYSDLKDASIKNNTILNNAKRPYGIALNYLNISSITNNKIDTSTGTKDTCIGLLLTQPFTSNTKTITIANNEITGFYHATSLSTIKSPTEFYNNVISTNNIGIYVNNINQISIKNNSIYNYKTDSTKFPSTITIKNSPNTFIYNTIIHSDLAAIEISDFTDPSYSPTKLISDNNLFYNKAKNTQFIIQNEYKTFTGWQNLGYDKTSFIANPLYTNTIKSPFDFHLRTLSPAIDKGNNTYAPPTTTDKDGNTRIVKGKTKSNIDIGAYEYQP